MWAAILALAPTIGKIVWEILRLWNRKAEERKKPAKIIKEARDEYREKRAKRRSDIVRGHTDRVLADFLRITDDAAARGAIDHRETARRIVADVRDVLVPSAGHDGRSDPGT